MGLGYFVELLRALREGLLAFLDRGIFIMQAQPVLQLHWSFE